jgi:hypothetical protein
VRTSKASIVQPSMLRSRRRLSDLSGKAFDQRLLLRTPAMTVRLASLARRR